MFQRYAFPVVTMASILVVSACSQGPQSPVSPTASGGATAANVDGSTLKVSAPTILSPKGGEVVESRRPVFTFSNSAGKFTSVPVVYRIEGFDAAGGFIGAQVVSASEGGQTAYQSASDFAYNTVFSWRVRAEFDGQAGPWSALESFKIYPQPSAGGPVTGGVGPQRAIQYAEAAGIIINIHNTLRINLGASSTRDFRIDFLNAAVAAIHYGHPRFNAAGPDPSWCVKDAGGGRPQSDDVIVLCQSRDAWDLIAGAGGNGYSFHDDYLGKLPSGQNVYPPPVGALNFLNR